MEKSCYFEILLAIRLFPQRRLHIEELCNLLYSFPNNIRQIKSRRMRWLGHVACMGEE
jgi:hypothetical protein